MTVESVVSIVLGVVSTVVAAYAIWLSAVFYRAGNEAQEHIREIANRLEASTDVLNTRLQGLQDQTFTLVRDTVEGMRSALWSNNSASPSQAIEREPELQIQMINLRKELLDEIARVVGSRYSNSPALESAIDEMVRRSARVGLSAGESHARDLIRMHLSATSGRGIAAGELMTTVGGEVPFGLVIRTLYEMRDGGELFWTEDELGPNSVLSLTIKGTLA